MASSPPPRRSFRDFTLADMIDFIDLQLDETNYLYWRCKMELDLPRHDMLQYIDPKVPIPPTETLDCTTNKLIPNRKYEEWIKVDQYILFQFIRTISEPVILSQISGFKTSREVWLHLEKSFFDQHSLRVPELRHQLLTLRKGILARPHLPAFYELRELLIEENII
ncbi:hypothetical protein MKW92_034153 [Papaver armeniacum]|nr:hypothetical protein MKW92_034153 [Papaver armeniacum]